MGTRIRNTQYAIRNAAQSGYAIRNTQYAIRKPCQTVLRNTQKAASRRNAQNAAYGVPYISRYKVWGWPALRPSQAGSPLGAGHDVSQCPSGSRIHRGYMRDTSGIHHERHVSQMYAERYVSEVQDTCEIHAGYMYPQR